MRFTPRSHANAGGTHRHRICLTFQRCQAHRPAIGARFHPAGPGTDVGGDFYDVFALTGRPDCSTIMVGDTVGSGAEAAATTALVRRTARFARRHYDDPVAIVAAVNEALLDGGQSGEFCTLVLAEVVLDAERVHVRVVNAGHPPGLGRHRDGCLEQISGHGRLLGAFDEVELFPIEVTMAGGDALILFTDGVLEARHAARPRDFFGYEGIRETLARLEPDATADTAADAIVAAASGFAGGTIHDDVAVLVLHVLTP